MAWEDDHEDAVTGTVVFLLEISPVQAQTSYFQGKTIRIVTGYPAGDVNDLWPRLIAHHMTKYIPGNPNFVIKICREPAR